MDTVSGWLSPDGLLYPCAFAEHQMWAQIFCRAFRVPRVYNNDIIDLCTAGWIGLKDKCFETDLLGSMTRAQYRAIKNYAALHRVKGIPTFIAWEEIRIFD